MQEIILPWPTRNLSPNSRAHWALRAKSKKESREYARIATLQAKITGLPESGRLAVWIDGYAPDRRHRDVDNFLASLKAALDGVADALGINDKRFVPYPYIKDEVKKGGEVRIRITGMPKRP